MRLNSLSGILRLRQFNLLIPSLLGVLCLLPVDSKNALLGAEAITQAFSASRSMVEIVAEGGGMFKVPAGSKGPARIRAIQFRKTGGGVILDPSGIIVTNAHILKNAGRIVVTMPDRKKYAAELLFIPEGEDLAFLKIHAEKKLPSIFFANSDKVAPKSVVYAIGNSPLLHGTLMEGRVGGFVKAKDREGSIRRFLRINFQIYSGDSGTAVFDGAGRLLGLITAGTQARRSPVALAIPSNRIKQFWDEYEKKNR